MLPGGRLKTDLRYLPPPNLIDMQLHPQRPMEHLLTDEKTSLVERSFASSFMAQGYCHVSPGSAEFLEVVDRAALGFANLMEIQAGDTPLAHAYRDKDGMARQLRFLHYQSPAFGELMRSREINEIVRQVRGTQRMYVTHSKISHKRPGQDQVWYPHQDNAYKLLHKLPIISGMTIAIFLEDADDNNGTIQVFPGSHHRKTMPHVPHPTDKGDPRQLVVQTLPNIEPLSIIARKGDILAFDLDLVHQSQPNLGGGSRPVFLFEIKPHNGLPMNEMGCPPVIVNGELSAPERLRYFLAWTLRRVAGTCTIR